MFTHAIIILMILSYPTFYKFSREFCRKTVGPDTLKIQVVTRLDLHTAGF